jgi:RNA-directed DNA polymerase
MKRHSNLYERICDPDNLRLADINARKGKGYQKEIAEHDKEREANIEALRQALITKIYRVPEYSTFMVYDPKEREVSYLPYIHKVLQHAILQVIGPIFSATFTADSYSGIKGKGTHAAVYDLGDALEDREHAQYYLKLDIRKYYPSVDHGIVKAMIRRKFKDKDLLWLLDMIIDSAPGLPIGNYTSMFFSNFFLTYFDHWMKEVMRVRYYFRYMDDMIILGSEKPYLHELLSRIKKYLAAVLKLEVKGNYKVWPVTEGIDFGGYVSFPGYRRLRKRNKQNAARKLKKTKKQSVRAAIRSWTKHGNCRNLEKKLGLHEKFQRTRNKIRAERVCGREDRREENIEPRGRTARLQDRAIEALRRPDMPSIADKA